MGNELERREHPELGWAIHDEQSADQQATELDGSHEVISEVPHSDEPVTHEFDKTPLADAPVTPTAPDFAPADLLKSRRPKPTDAGMPDYSGVPTAEFTAPQRYGTEQSRGFWTRGRKVGAAVIAVVAVAAAGTGTALAFSGGNSPRQHQTADASPGKTEANPAPTQVSPSQVPHSIATTPNTMPSATPTDPIEQMKRLTPNIAIVDPNNPSGSIDAINTIFSDIQLANQTGEIKFLEAALGSQNMQGDLSRLYSNDMQNDQQFFAAHPTAATSYSYTAEDIQPAPGSTSWYVNAKETVYDTTGQQTGYATHRQLLTLVAQPAQDGSSSQQWVLQNVQVLPSN